MHNFFFFFCKRKPRSVVKLNIGLIKFLKFKKKLKSSKEWLDYLSIRKIKFAVRLRRSNKLKKTLKKKQALKSLFKRHYLIKNDTQFYTVRKKVKKKINKVLFLFFFFESQLPTVCLRFHFFWTLRKAYQWVSQKSTAVNGLIIDKIRHRIGVNDYIKIIGPRFL